MENALNISTVANSIQLSAAPVFLLTAIGAILAVLADRLARVVDRYRNAIYLLGNQARSIAPRVIAVHRGNACLDHRIALHFCAKSSFLQERSSRSGDS
jgi:hypothetical protein